MPIQKFVPSGERDSTRGIFTLNKSKLLGCIPLKTGNTNWLKAFVALMLHERSGLYTRPETIPVTMAFGDSSVPRYFPDFDEIFVQNADCIENGLKQRASNEDIISFITVRHPLSRKGFNK